MCVGLCRGAAFLPGGVPLPSGDLGAYLLSLPEPSTWSGQCETIFAQTSPSGVSGARVMKCAL